MNSKLQLGPLPDLSVVRLTIKIPATLKEAIDRYAELHTKTWGTRVDAETLIPHIVETFLPRIDNSEGSYEQEKNSGPIPDEEMCSPAARVGNIAKIYAYSYRGGMHGEFRW